MASHSKNDRPFRHFTLKHRVVAWISENIFDHVIYTSRHGLTEGMKRKGGLGWIPASIARKAESHEEKFWRSLDLRGLVVYDVGAFHGLLALFFARQARQVICYEPNSRNHSRLMENIRLNHLDNVLVRKLGLGSEPQEANLVYSPLMTGGASLEQSIAGHTRDSLSGARTEQIQVTTLDRDIPGASLPAPNFLKIDVEGWELEALRGARNTLRQYAPALFLEMHGNTMNEKRRKVAEIVAYLDEIGYKDILHVESGLAVTPEDSERAAEGHLYCAPRRDF